MIQSSSLQWRQENRRKVRKASRKSVQNKKEKKKIQLRGAVLSASTNQSIPSANPDPVRAQEAWICQEIPRSFNDGKARDDAISAGDRHEGISCLFANKRIGAFRTSFTKTNTREGEKGGPHNQTVKSVQKNESKSERKEEQTKQERKNWTLHWRSPDYQSFYKILLWLETTVRDPLNPRRKWYHHSW